jgi:hypothetical protein
MKKRKLSIALLLATAFWAAPAAAQNIYRCGDSYSQQPCPGGTVVRAEDARSASQRSQTSQAAERDAKWADAMEKARLKEEAKPVQAYIPASKASAEAAPDEKKKPVLTKPRKPQYFTATSPRKPGEPAAKKKKKKKARKTTA